MWNLCLGDPTPVELTLALGHRHLYAGTYDEEEATKARTDLDPQILEILVQCLFRDEVRRKDTPLHGCTTTLADASSCS